MRFWTAGRSARMGMRTSPKKSFDVTLPAVGRPGLKPITSPERRYSSGMYSASALRHSAPMEKPTVPAGRSKVTTQRGGKHLLFRVGRIGGIDLDGVHGRFGEVLSEDVGHRWRTAYRQQCGRVAAARSCAFLAAAVFRTRKAVIRVVGQVAQVLFRGVSEIALEAHRGSPDVVVVDVVAEGQLHQASSRGENRQTVVGCGRVRDRALLQGPGAGFAGVELDQQRPHGG